MLFVESHPSYSPDLPLARPSSHAQVNMPIRIVPAPVRAEPSELTMPAPKTSILSERRTHGPCDELPPSKRQRPTNPSMNEPHAGAAGRSDISRVTFSDISHVNFKEIQEKFQAYIDSFDQLRRERKGGFRSDVTKRERKMIFEIFRDVRDSLEITLSPFQIRNKFFKIPESTGGKKNLYLYGEYTIAKALVIGRVQEKFQGRIEGRRNALLSSTYPLGNTLNKMDAKLILDIYDEFKTAGLVGELNLSAKKSGGKFSKCCKIIKECIDDLYPEHVIISLLHFGLLNESEG